MRAPDMAKIRRLELEIGRLTCQREGHAWQAKPERRVAGLGVVAECTRCTCVIVMRNL